MSQNKLKIAVIGATGFVGLDLTFLLSKHKRIKVNYLCATKNVGKPISFFDKRISKKLPNITKLNKINWDNVDLVFLSLPNGEAQKLISKHFNKLHLKFIDLSADFRLTKPEDYRRWYKQDHKSKHLIKDSIYAISEIAQSKIKQFRIIANPGCYPTSIQLPLYPLIKKNVINLQNITIDSKSGYSGAGKNYKNKFNHKNLLSSVFAYGIVNHRHMSEIDQEFKKFSSKKINYTFNPHLLPTFRGILSTIYIEPKKNFNVNKILSIVKAFYSKNKFIKILKKNTPLGTNNVINKNICEISICETRYKNKIVILSAIDNLIKGASGQAIQNMNILYNFKETEGLL
jgi:N-acetyl-gamma-glutamyl-phosphate reductase